MDDSKLKLVSGSNNRILELNKVRQDFVSSVNATFKYRATGEEKCGATDRR